MIPNLSEVADPVPLTVYDASTISASTITEVEFFKNSIGMNSRLLIDLLFV